MTKSNNLHRCPTIEEYKAILKKHSLKATPQRIAVHEAMMSLGHACADMVTEAICENVRFPSFPCNACQNGS